MFDLFSWFVLHYNWSDGCHRHVCCWAILCDVWGVIIFGVLAVRLWLIFYFWGDRLLLYLPLRHFAIRIKLLAVRCGNLPSY